MTTRIMSRPLAALVLLLCVSSSGCRAVRSNLGVGPGLGVEVQLSGLVRVGALALYGISGGQTYGQPQGLEDVALTLGPVFYRRSQLDAERRELGFGLLHGVTHRWIEGNRRAHPWAFDMTVALLFVHWRVGFDPLELSGSDSFPSESLEPPPFDAPS
jgi:hypothetical protein